MPAEAVLRCMDSFTENMIDRKRAERYCSEDISEIENYEQAVNDKTQTWHCHHKLEIQGQFQNSPALLKKCGLYYHVPAWQLVFLTSSEHRRLHNIGERHPMFGKYHSEESRKKMSISRSGEKNHMFGKHMSAETRKRVSDRKIGRKWFTNGVDEICQYECPGEGWVRGRIKHLRKTK